MTRAARAVAAVLIAAASLASPAALLAQGRPADAPGKEAMDAALARCRTTSECLTIGRRYQSVGLAQDARAAVDRAATFAKAASEWHSVSSSYQVLGYQQLADDAFQKAQRAPIR
jgi:hypothetical protein